MKSLQSIRVATLTALWAVAAGPVAAAAPPPEAATAAPPAVAGTPPFDLSDAARIEIGKKRFNSTCAAYCHGAEGEGGKTPPFRGNKDLTPQIAFKTITEGRRGTDIMPPWGNGFTPEQIWELVAYINFLTTQPPKQQ
ncbi:c-type cytochrome [Methylibium sp.]|uniref:c-type cytochrome n=1 Tax=Methylibium sp. TaxID=2067992 RepID=UPI003D1325D7